MRFDSQTLMYMQRRAYKALTAHSVVEHHSREKGVNGALGAIPKATIAQNKHYVAPKLTSSPGMIIQELGWVNTTTTFNFDFSQTAPAQLPGVNNNVTLAKNDVFAIYAFQILFGTGTNSADFIYRSHGVLPADDSMYNSTVSVKTESSTYIDKMEGQFFRDNPANSNEYYGEIGLQVINPIRIVSGELGVFKLILTLKNPIAALVISANTVISMRLHGVYGQAQG
jgi:hypothetical protein